MGAAGSGDGIAEAAGGGEVEAVSSQSGLYMMNSAINTKGEKG